MCSYLVSPWCENGDAPKYLKKNPNADRVKLVSEFLSLLIRMIDSPVCGMQILEIAYGLRYLHSQNPPIAHGSLQGSNVLIGDGGGALLADFGLSKALEDLTAVPFTQSTGANGCFRWMAPELHEDGGRMTLKSDTYAWGMTALELMSGKVPYSRIKMPGSVVMEVSRGRVPERPRRGGSTGGGVGEGGNGVEISDRLWRLLVRCWARDGANRPTIHEIIEELEDIRRTEPSPMEI